MEPSSLRHYLASLIFLFLALYTLPSKANTAFNSDEIRPRFEAMECIITPRYTSQVETFIKRYLAYDGKQTRSVMSRAAIYFPIYEKYLKEHNLPQDLKFLSIVESALHPTAVSRAGATGLWQFMAQTGRNNGLVIDKYVDERHCPYNATEAAMEYLSKLFERYGSWEMALAAYNCGSGTLNHAMKRSRSDNYWTLSKYLPRETQNFVPAFLGAAYIGNFYHLHNIEPDYPNLDMQVTQAIEVFQKIDFATIAGLSNLPVEVVEKLNPAFKKDFVPENPQGHDVILPRRSAQALIEYLEAVRPDQPRKVEMPPIPSPLDTAAYRPDELYFRSVYVVAEGDNIDDIAEVFNCAPYNLKVWNKLSSYHLTKGQELTIWFPNEHHHYLPKETRLAIAPPVVMAEPAMAPAPEPKPEVFERDDRPAPDAILAPALKVATHSPKPTVAARQVVQPAAKPEEPNMVDRIIEPIKNLKIEMPKLVQEIVRPAPQVRQPEFLDVNGHGLN